MYYTSPPHSWGFRWSEVSEPRPQERRRLPLTLAPRHECARRPYIGCRETSLQDCRGLRRVSTYQRRREPVGLDDRGSGRARSSRGPSPIGSAAGRVAVLDVHVQEERRHGRQDPEKGWQHPDDHVRPSREAPRRPQPKGDYGPPVEESGPRKDPRKESLLRLVRHTTVRNGSERKQMGYVARASAARRSTFST